MKYGKRKLSVAPMMDWTEEAVCTESEQAGL
jgi:tRNA-dihydrouridine synthase